MEMPHRLSAPFPLKQYRCYVCSQETADGDNVFNRKDLFTTHLRRMHPNSELEQALYQGNNEQQYTTRKALVDGMLELYLIKISPPPPRCCCPKHDCSNTDKMALGYWIEHVGCHVENGKSDELHLDHLLLEYAKT